ncbi:hypothetical protein S7711_07723 [Stachybotrys chartarum IBT 7711]|uniref:Uncharacterized protein n=1 Tax=Stachybotrys chartarum (strain CBS 109288 / IBT 7711) TaxID=1280523 RepID=A0A084B7Z8_STACB|nr:hypothetical protein S7711_07723 [Stachybotrys chartarum IBT 7711]
MSNTEPQCGGGNQSGADDYDLPLHVAAIFIVMGASLFGAGFPVAAKKIKWLNIPADILFACKHFGTGVLIATAFVHLLPTAFGSLTDPCLPDLFTDVYPAMPGVIMMAAMFVVFVIEMYLNSKTGGHSHGGPTGSNFHSATAPVRPARPYTADFDFGLNNDIAMEKHVMQDTYPDEKKQVYQVENRPASVALDNLSQMPPWFIVFYEQYVRQREETMSQIRSLQTRDTPPAPKYEAQPTDVSAFEVSADSPYLDDNGQPVDPQLYKKLSANITLLEGGILFHSVFIGMTISITTEGFIILLIAIVFHQMFEGLGLGSRIAAVPYARNSIRPWVLVAAFGVTAPIGQAIGLLTKDTYDPNSALGLIMVGTFNAISSGLLIYASLVDLLAEDFLTEESRQMLTKRQRIGAFLWVLAGGELMESVAVPRLTEPLAAGMSVIGAFA